MVSLIVESRWTSLGRFSAKKQFRCFHGQISFRRGENLFPISAILESELSNFTLIILEDIYYIYITVLSL